MAAAVLAAVWTFCRSASDAPASPPWRPFSAAPVVAPVTALARDATGRLAVADRRGVWLGLWPDPAGGAHAEGASGDAAPLARVLRVTGVRDLAFDAEGSLWSAGDEGLHHRAPGTRAGPARDRTPAPGEANRRLHRILVDGALGLAAGEGGAFVSADGGRWQRLAGLPAGPVPGAALRVGEGGGSLWLVAGGSVWRIAVSADGEPLDAPRAVAALAASGREPLDVVLDAADRPWVLFRDGCTAPIGSELAPGPEVVPRCRGIPPGAEARRLVPGAGRWWLATDRGLLEASAPGGPWSRAAPPAGTASVHDVADATGTLLVATDRDLLASGPRPDAPAVASKEAAAPAAARALARALREEGREPPVDAVRRAALAYLDLGPGRLRRLRRGAARRGWLPQVSLRLDRDVVTDRRDDRDETFVSGGHRLLFDRQRDRRATFEATLQLSWDLGDVVYHPESVDASRETRQLVELRDDVLDEIHQLYFERQRVLLQLLTLEPDQAVEAARLRLRAEELAAGIDAWTGGWFGRRTRRWPQ